MCEPCTVLYELFILVVVDESDDPFYVIYFVLVWLGYHVLYDIHFITHYTCKLDMAMYSVNYWTFIPSVHIRIASILFDVC